MENFIFCAVNNNDNGDNKHKNINNGNIHFCNTILNT